MKAHEKPRLHEPYRFHDADKTPPVTSGKWPTIVRKQRLRDMIRLYDEGLTHDQIGRSVGLSAGRVGQILRTLDLRNRR